MEIKESLAPLELELKKVSALQGSMAFVVVPFEQADVALRARREMDTAVRYKDHLVIGVFGMGADEASAHFLSIPKGIAVYPGDGTDVQALILEALERFNHSRGSSPWVKSLWESIREKGPSTSEADGEGKFLVSTFYQFYAFLGSHLGELRAVEGVMAPADRRWLEDLLPQGSVSSPGEPQDRVSGDFFTLMDQWPYREMMEAKQELGKKTLRRFRNIENLFTLPSISQEVIALAGDDLVAASRMAKVIEKDPVLTSRLLKVVNSAFYGFRRQIDSVEHAVVILGNDEVVNLAFSIAIHQIMDRIAPRKAQLLWEHSLLVAHLSQWLGPVLGCSGGNMLYTLGLLHDFGKIIFLQRGCGFGDLTQVSSLEGLAAEERETGVSHAEMGAFVAERWNLPETIVDGLQSHHQPSKAADPATAVTVHVADIIAHTGCIDMGAINTAAARYLLEGRMGGISPEIVARRFEDTRTRVKNLLDA